MHGWFYLIIQVNRCMKTILLTASSGGHFEQLMVLKNKLKNVYNVYVLTEKTKYTKDDDYTFYVRQLNRKKISFPLKYILNYFKVKKIINKIKPDVVISTGALATISPCKIAHRKKIKVIFIESFAKVDTPTRTGKYIYKFADKFIVQWESLLRVYPKALFFEGGIY